MIRVNLLGRKRSLQLPTQAVDQKAYARLFLSERAAIESSKKDFDDNEAIGDSAPHASRRQPSVFGVITRGVL